MTKATRAGLEVIDKGATTGDHPTPLLFVHGACHAAWCWDEHFLDHFADHGFRAVALSLRGHGRSSWDKPLRRCSLADFVDDVATVADSLEVAPVVIGHSMGGFIVQHYLQKQRSPAGVLLASIPPRGVGGTSRRFMRRHPVASLRSNATRRPEICFHQPRTREMLFSPGTPQSVVDACLVRVESESTRALWTDSTFRRPKPARIVAPVLVLGGEHDGCFTVKEVHATARAYRTEAQILPGMGHNMMLEPGWPDVANRIESWLAGLRL